MPSSANPYTTSYLLEHGLRPDGRPNPDANIDPGSMETVFTETGNGKYVPRSIFVDLDPSVRELFSVKMRTCSPCALAN